MLSRRVQLLLDEERYERVAAVARDRNVSVAKVIREAIDRTVTSDAQRRRSAADAFLSAEPMDVADDPADLKAELAQMHEYRVPEN
jgi:hypothetical protein